MYASDNDEWDKFLLMNSNFHLKYTEDSGCISFGDQEMIRY